MDTILGEIFTHKVSCVFNAEARNINEQLFWYEHSLMCLFAYYPDGDGVHPPTTTSECRILSGEWEI